MKSLLKYMSSYKKEAILAPLFKLLEASFDLIVPLVVASMIDRGALGKDRVWILLCALALTLLATLGLAAAFTAQFYAAKAAIGFVSKIRRALFRKINTLSFAQLDRFGEDSLVVRLTADANQLQSGVNLVLRLFMRSPFIVFGATIMAFAVDARAGCVFLVALPIMAAIVFGVMFATIPLYARARRLLDGIALAARENLVGARVVRAFNLQESETRAFRERARRFAAAQRFVGAIAGTLNPGTFVVVNLALVALIYVGGVRVEAGDLTQGQTVALLNYMTQILVELVKLANLIVQTNRAIACGNRIGEALETTSDMVDGDVELRPTSAGVAVAFRGVSFRYAGASSDALTDVSFEARVGETIGIVGGSGSGKSTLANLISRFYDATSGAVEIFGLDARRCVLRSLRDAIALAPQRAELFSGTAASNLRWGREDADDATLYRALEIAQARAFVDAKPGGLAFEIEQGGRNLSGGQKQRLAIARALVKPSPILILDDSFSALDFATEARLRDALRRSRPRDATTFIVAQRASSVLFADRILVLEDGRLVGEGSNEDLLATNETYREIYYSQFPPGDARAFERGER